MTAPVDVLAIIDAERPLMAAASALAAHDAMRAAVLDLIGEVDRIADFLVGHGEVADLASCRLRDAILKARGAQ